MNKNLFSVNKTIYGLVDVDFVAALGISQNKVHFFKVKHMESLSTYNTDVPIFVEKL